jgi:hypothetical protein
MNRNPHYRDNLKPWPKGTSGNPAGRPPTKILREIARELIETKDKKTGKTIGEKLVRLAIARAERGSIRHLQFLADLCETETGMGWPGQSQLDGDAIARLVTKLCR